MSGVICCAGVPCYRPLAAPSVTLASSQLSSSPRGFPSSPLASLITTTPSLNYLSLPPPPQHTDINNDRRSNNNNHIWVVKRNIRGGTRLGLMSRFLTLSFSLSLFFINLLRGRTLLTSWDQQKSLCDPWHPLTVSLFPSTPPSVGVPLYPLCSLSVPL